MNIKLRVKISDCPRLDAWSSKSLVVLKKITNLDFFIEQHRVMLTQLLAWEIRLITCKVNQSQTLQLLDLSGFWKGSELLTPSYPGKDHPRSGWILKLMTAMGWLRQPAPSLPTETRPGRGIFFFSKVDVFCWLQLYKRLHYKPFLCVCRFTRFTQAQHLLKKQNKSHVQHPESAILWKNNQH